eukprot:UN22252
MELKLNYAVRITAIFYKWIIVELILTNINIAVTFNQLVLL